ncbi:MAG: Trk system potassium uptake protein TrkH [Chlamydiales bacterium]|nr:Trk system potassium uptake protein TrkH [Chlamydiales bacterium]
MLYRDICKTLSFYMWILLIPLSIPFCIAAYCEWIVGPEVYPQPPAAFAFLLTLFITAALGGVFWLIGQKRTGHLYRREALLLVLLVYLFTPAVSALPFFLSKTLTNPIDAFFEAVSGVTTTGATVMQAKAVDPFTEQERPIQRNVQTGQKTDYSYYGTLSPIIEPETKAILLSGLDAVSPSLLFWRSFMQWLGGGGIIVLFVAILPALGVGGKILYQTEVTGPSKESMMPRIKETASQLWKIYLGLTILEVILLMVTNHSISFFDAVTTSFSTISTGGFTARNGGIAAFHNAYTDWVIIVFMVLGSISFSIYFFCMRGKFYRLKDPELIGFLLIILCVVAITTWQLIGKFGYPLSPAEQTGELGFFGALRFGAFQVISAQTSTGFTTANYDLWPFSIQVLMLALFFIGGMAGSTAGGLKVIRHQTFFRIMLDKIESIYRPDTVRTYRVGNSIIDNRTATTVLCFIMVSAFLAILGTFLLVLDGVDPETGLSTVSCMLNNVGIAFRMGGPVESFAFLSNWSKLLACFWMVAGRLEYFAVLIAFVPAFWRTSY